MRSVATGPDPRPQSGVQLVRWPEETDLLERLRVARVPRLLLVRPGSPAPVLGLCEEDWVRLPAEDADVRARAQALAVRAAQHHPSPEVSADGRLRYRGNWVSLSPLEHRLAAELVGRFGEVVDEDALARAAWGSRPVSRVSLRVQLTRLRRQVRPLNLSVRNVRGRGYVLDPD